MPDPGPSPETHSALLSARLARVAKKLAAEPANAQPWDEAARAIAYVREKEAELARIVEARDLPALEKLVADWGSSALQLPEDDRSTLKSAVKAFRKSLKLTQLDDESGIGGGAMSSGKRSGIVGIAPPARFAPDVWEELVRQGRLVESGRGIFELRSDGTPD
jgi:hypothetical protein